MLTNTQLNYAVTHPLFNYMFSKVIFAPLAGLGMRVTHMFLLFFRNSFFIVYQHSDLEGSCSNGAKTRHVNLVACGSWGVTRSDVRLHDLKHLRKGIVERLVRALGRCGPRVVSLSPCFKVDVWGVKYCWNRCSSILGFETSS